RRIVIGGDRRGRVAIGDEVLRLVLWLDDAGDRLVGEVHVLRERAHAQVNGTDRSGRLSAFVHLGVDGPADIVDQVGVGLRERWVYEGPVHHERAVVTGEKVHRGVLVRGREARPRETLLPDAGHDLSGIPAGGGVQPELHLVRRRLRVA